MARTCKHQGVSDWVPLLQTLAWVGLIAAILIGGRANWGAILQAFERRISQGDDMTLKGPLGLSAELKREAKGLPRFEPGEPDKAPKSKGSTADDLTALREQMGADQRGIHLVHVVAPSDQPGQEYDALAYLYGWGRNRFKLPDDLSDVAHAEFFLGPLFTPDRVTVKNEGARRIGFTTTIHAPALCLCKITFADGHVAVVSRYLDFESGEIAKALTGGR